MNKLALVVLGRTRGLPRMNRLALVVLLAAVPSFAADLSSHSDDGPRPPQQGLYAALGVGGALVGPELRRDLDVEARLGYSFSPRIQLYLSGAYDVAIGSSIGIGESSRDYAQHDLQITADLQYHFFASSQIGFHLRGGAGVGSSQLDRDSTRFSGLGLAGNIGLGGEVLVSPGLHLGTELFYRHARLSGDLSGSSAQPSSAKVSSDALGLQLNLIYY